MKNRPAANTIYGDSVDEICVVGGAMRANGSGKKAKLVGLDGGEPDPADFRSDFARRAHWRHCYGDMWKLKVAFDKEHNSRIR